MQLHFLQLHIFLCTLLWGIIMSENNVLLKMEHISKSFPGVKALDDVQLTLKAGTVHALWVRMELENRH